MRTSVNCGMQLLIPNKDIEYWANRYDYPLSETNLINQKPHIEKQGYLTKNILEELCMWKSPRSAGYMKRNSEEYINEITQISFQSKNERTKIQILTILDGVDWPTASVILHLFANDKYPILDFRALWSINIENYKYNFNFWWDYVLFTRELSEKHNIDMRTLDRALWQYSKNNQPV